MPPLAARRIVHDHAHPNGAYLGGGSWGQVYLASLKRDPTKKVALKFIDPSKQGYDMSVAYQRARVSRRGRGAVTQRSAARRGAARANPAPPRRSRKRSSCTAS